MFPLSLCFFRFTVNLNTTNLGKWESRGRSSADLWREVTIVCFGETTCLCATCLCDRTTCLFFSEKKKQRKIIKIIIFPHPAAIPKVTPSHSHMSLSRKTDFHIFICAHKCMRINFCSNVLMSSISVI